MEKWSEQRIAAYKRYIEHDTKKLKSWRRELEAADYKSDVARKTIKNYEQRIAEDKASLAAQGVEIDIKK